MRNTTLFKIHGTKTFRLSSTKVLGHYGSNLQNVNDYMRRIYVPDDDKVFIQVDQSGADALIVAYLCTHGKFRDLFLHGVKPHVFVALHLFKEEWAKRLTDINLTPFIEAEPKELKLLPRFTDVDELIKSSDAWKGNERYYAIAKLVCHGLNYGMKPRTFMMNALEKSEGSVVLTFKEAEYYYNTYHSLFPELEEWHKWTNEQIYNKRELRNLFGYPRIFTKNMSDNLLRDAYSWIPQSTVGCITNIAYTKVQNLIEDHKLPPDCDLLGNCHDSYLGQCKEEHATLFASIMKENMEQRLVSPRGEAFKMRSGVSKGLNWGKFCTENPEGMKELK